VQPPTDPLDLAQVFGGVIDAERGAVEHYDRIIRTTDGVDPVTQDERSALLDSPLVGQHCSMGLVESPTVGAAV
jgi:ferritin-like protein